MTVSRVSRWAILAGCALLISGCAETELVIHSAKELTGSANGASVAKTKGSYKVGRPYRIQGTWYYPAENFKYVETGISSWYGQKFHGRKTANGETYNMNDLTAAHRTLPMPSMVRVINLKNGRSLKLRINDRGPFARSRIIDVSRRAAQLLGFQRAGTASVRVEIIADESRQLKLAALNGRLPPREKITGQAVAKQTVQSQPLRTSQTTPRARRERIVSAPQQSAAVPATGNQTVETVPTPAVNRLFVQAGAFADFANASRVRTSLSKFGASWVEKAKVGNRDFYRVRIGPLQTLDNADAVLSRLISAGFPKARIVVD
jgi:rare lipoprotein A